MEEVGLEVVQSLIEQLRKTSISDLLNIVKEELQDFRINGKRGKNLEN